MYGVTLAGLQTRLVEVHPAMRSVSATGRAGRSSPTRRLRRRVHRTRFTPTAIQRRTRSSRLAEPLARHLIPVDGVEVAVRPGTPRAETGSRLATALLAYVAAITAVVTLLPFEFAIPTQPRVMVSGGLVDVLANVALFLPLGFLYAVARQDANVSPHKVALVALVVSASIESIQLFEVTRYASLSDVVANGSGAYIGAVLQRLLSRRIAMDAKTVGRLSLELPLMGLVYLLIPLLWVDGLAGAESPTLLWPLLALGLFGASLLASMQRHHFGPHHRVSREMMAGAACAWFLLGAFPGLAPRASIVLFVMLSAIGAFVWVRSADQTPARPINRRFESRALWEGAPFYAAYLLLLVAPTTEGLAPSWRWAFGFGTTPGLDSQTVLHIVETVAAFTLLGYMLAEFRGRLEARFRNSAPHIAWWSGVAALVAEVMEGFRVDGEASALRCVVLVGASVYGAWIYHLQRAHVRRLLGRG
jgi:glycopeptide antibiotics resistance protein